MLQGDPVLRDRAKGTFSLLLSLEQTEKVSIMVLTLWFNIKKTIITARFARGAEKGRRIKANKQDAVLCDFAVKSNFYALKGFK